jgi:hypothetical protein
MGDDQRRRQAAEHGAADFLAKPVAFEHLKTQLRSDPSAPRFATLGSRPKQRQRLPRAGVGVGSAFRRGRRRHHPIKPGGPHQRRTVTLPCGTSSCFRTGRPFTRRMARPARWQERRRAVTGRDLLLVHGDQRGTAADGSYRRRRMRRRRPLLPHDLDGSEMRGDSVENQQLELIMCDRWLR